MRPLNCFINASNCGGVSDCGPSDSASFGFGCTSTINPSAPAAMPARATAGARLVRASAKEHGTTCLYRMRSSENLLARLDCAGAGNDGDVASADFDVADRDDGRLVFHLAADEFEGLGDANRFGDSGQH